MDYFAAIIESIRTSDSVTVLREHAASYSGYVREAVLKRAAELAHPELLPEVAARLNDWVPAVRKAARVAWSVLQPHASAGQLMAILPLLRQLHNGAREDNAGWLAIVERQLIQQVGGETIRVVAASPDLRIARAAVHLLLDYQLMPLVDLIGLMLKRRDDVVLAHRAVVLCAQLAPEQQELAYRAAARTHFAVVRTMAVRALLAMPIKARMEIAVAALDDLQSSIRSAAAIYLLAAGFDVRGHYRARLESEHPAQRTRVYLAALAAQRDAADLELIKSHVDSRHPAIRAAALSAWFKLAPHDKDDIALTAMHDAAPGVRKLAVQLVSRYGAYIPFSLIRSQLETSDSVGFFLLLSETNRWNWLEAIARVGLRVGAEEARKLRLEEGLLAWLRDRQCYVYPDLAQQQFLLSQPVTALLTDMLQAYPDNLKALPQHLRLAG